MVFTNNYKDPFEESPSDIVKALLENFNEFIRKYGNFYVYRAYTEVPADDADILTGESQSGNNFTYTDTLIKGYVGHPGGSVGKDGISVIPEGVISSDNVNIYLQSNILTPKKGDVIFNVHITKEFNINNISKELIHNAFRCLHIIEYKVAGYLIYYTIKAKELL